MTQKEQSTLGGIIQTQIQNTINEQPAPTTCEITKTYNDNHVDIKTETYGNLKYIESIISHEIGDKTILIFLNNNYNKKMVI